MPLEVVKTATANEVLSDAWQGCNVQEIVTQLWVSERQAQKWRAPISESETGQMNPLGRADQVIKATQAQSQQSALVLIAWLLINFIRRSLPDKSGNAQVIWRLETIFSELRLKVVCALSEEEQKKP